MYTYYLCVLSVSSFLQMLTAHQQSKLSVHTCPYRAWTLCMISKLCPLQFLCDAEYYLLTTVQSYWAEEGLLLYMQHCWVFTNTWRDCLA